MLARSSSYRAIARVAARAYVPSMTPTPPLIWAYTYRLSPPQAAGRLRHIRELIEEEHALIAAEQGTWEGRLVVDDRVAHILVLSNSPELSRNVNQRIEEELARMGAGYTITVPMAIPADKTPSKG